MISWPKQDETAVAGKFTTIVALNWYQNVIRMPQQFNPGSTEVESQMKTKFKKWSHKTQKAYTITKGLPDGIYFDSM